MSDGSAVLLVIRMIVSLAVVLGILVVLGRIMHRRYGGQLRKSSGVTASIEVIARQSLSRSATVHVVRVGAETLLLGVTDQGINVLAQGDGLGQSEEQSPALARPELPAGIPARGWLARLMPKTGAAQSSESPVAPARAAAKRPTTAPAASPQVRPAQPAARTSSSGRPGGGLLGQLRGREHDQPSTDTHDGVKILSKQQASGASRRDPSIARTSSTSVTSSVPIDPNDFDGRVEARLSQAQVLQFTQAEPPARTLLERAYVEARLPVGEASSQTGQAGQVAASGQSYPAPAAKDQAVGEPMPTPSAASTALLRGAQDQSDAMTQVVARVLKRQDRRRG